MDYYLDIEILPDAEFSHNTILNILGLKLHQFLVERKELEIGVSFPNYSLKPRTLGNRLRLHGNQQSLEQVLKSDWLSLLRDHIKLSSVAQRPLDCGYVDVRRVQAKSSTYRLAKRYARRHAVSLEEALELYKDKKDEKLNYPFLSLVSKTTGQRFNLFIKQSAPHKEFKEGEFNRYGISKTASLPWF